MGSSGRDFQASQKQNLGFVETLGLPLLSPNPTHQSQNYFTRPPKSVRHFLEGDLILLLQKGLY